MNKGDLRIPYSLKETRDNLVKQLWDTRRFTMEEIGKIFRLDTSQIFYILNPNKTKKQLKLKKKKKQ